MVAVCVTHHWFVMKKFHRSKHDMNEVAGSISFLRRSRRKENSPSPSLGDVAGDNPKSVTDYAIERLNTSVRRLYKTTNLLTSQLMEQEWSKEIIGLEQLTTENLDAEIRKVGNVTEQLIPTQNKAEKRSLNVIEAFLSFVGRTVRAITPALKTFLEVAVQGSAVRLSLLF